MRLPWALFGIILPLGVSLACGSGEDRPRGGSGGRDSEDAGSGGSRSSGGREASGGSENSGGSGGTSGTGGGAAKDTTPPTFQGATGVEKADVEDRVRVLWSAASDDVSPEKRIAYRVYRAMESGAQDFGRGRRCGDPDPSKSPTELAKLPCYVTSGSGATSALVRDVIPAHPFFFVARAVDEAGNEDDNATEVTAQTDDTTSPEFGGVRGVSVASATSLRVTWGPGYDVASSDAELKFRVYAAAGKDPDPSKDDPILESGAGEHEAVVTGLDPLTAYRVIVRAVDPTGNEDANVRILGATTPEGIPPTFDGVSHALEQGLGDDKKGRVRVFWAPATDNVTDSANILYDVYQSLRQRGETFTRPTYTSTPGASSMLVSGLEPGTRYYYVVRARDVGGNRDANIKEISVVTRTLDQTAPNFTGISNATSVTPTSVDLTWGRATDAVSNQQAGITYLIYVSETTPVDTAGTPFMVVQGATSVTVGGLLSGKAYHFAAKARDQAGNITAATAERSATTLPADAADTVAPDFSAAALQVVTDKTKPTTMSLSWTAATDTSGAPNVRYLVCAAMAQSDCQGADFFRHVVATTSFGTVAATVQFLTVRTSYAFVVRAEDRAGNVAAAPPAVNQATPTSFSVNVLPILAARCGACHDFRDAAVLLGASHMDWACPEKPIDGCRLNFVEKNKPELSAIYRRVNPPNLRTSPFSASVPNEYGGLQEPRDTQDKLTGAEDDILRTWIVQGAEAN